MPASCGYHAPMRALTLLLAIASCTPAAPTVPDTAPLTQAVAVWRANPGPDSLQTVAELAGELGEHPVGARSVDLPLGEALCDVLLRPDLGQPRLAPYAAEFTAKDADPWLDCLLRRGDLETFAAEVGRLHGRTLDVEVDSLKAASVQARSHHEIDWRQAVRAHDAGSIADARDSFGRALDRPVPHLGASFAVLRHIFPGDVVHAVVTRSANDTAEDDPLVSPGVIPSLGGRRRVLGYATTPEEHDALAERVRTGHLSRVVGVAIEVRDPKGAVRVNLCAEGQMQGDQLWLLTACEPDRELAWLEATERFLDLQVAGASELEAGRQVRDQFRDRLTRRGEQPG